MPKPPTRRKTSLVPLVLNASQQTWVRAALQIKRPAETDPDEPSEVTQYRRELERHAEAGYVSAMADLIRMDPGYLTRAWLVETVRVLRSEAHFARTPQDRAHSTEGLRLLGRALGAGDLRGRRPYPSPKHITTLYELLLPVYQQAAKRSRPTPPPNELPIDLCLLYFGEQGPLPKGITRSGDPGG